MNIIDKLKSLGVEVTEEIEKAFPGEFVSALEVEKKTEKINVLEQDKETLIKEQANLEKELQTLKDNAPDADALNTKINELTETLEKERKERAEKDEKDWLGGLVADFFKDKHFVNEITANAIKEQLVSKLNSDEARGKSISDLFDGLVKGEDGKYKPDILIDDKDYEAQQKKRAALRGANIDQPGGAKLSMAELMKLKNQNPDMDITPYLK